MERTQVFRRKPTPRFEVPVLTTLVLGTLLAVAFVAVISVIPESWSAEEGAAAMAADLRAKVLERGAVQFTIVVLFWWSIAYCILKGAQVAGLGTGEFRRLEEVAIPRKITAGNAHEVMESIGLTGNLPFDFRLHRGLQIIADQKDPQAAGGFLASQAQADEEAVFRSYAFLRFSMWAMPILGFIGTVVGISGGVSHFAGSLGGTAQFETIRASLTGVTEGLTTAFDTTLAGLVGTTVVTLIYTMMLRREQTVLGRVDAVLRRDIAARFTANEQQEVDALTALAASVRELVQTPAITEEQVRSAIDGAMRDGAQSFSEIGRAIEGAAAAIADAIQDRFRQSLEHLQTEQRKLTERLVEAASQTLQKVVDGQSAGLAMHLARMKDLSAQTQQLIDLQTETIARMTAAERTQLADVRQVHQSLQAVLPLVSGLSKGFQLAPIGHAPNGSAGAMPASRYPDGVDPFAPTRQIMPPDGSEEGDDDTYTEANILGQVDEISDSSAARGVPMDLNADYGESGPRMSATGLVPTATVAEVIDGEPVLEATPITNPPATSALEAMDRVFATDGGDGESAGIDAAITDVDGEWAGADGEEAWGESQEIWNESAADRAFSDTDELVDADAAESIAEVVPEPDPDPEPDPEPEADNASQVRQRESGPRPSPLADSDIG